MIPYSHDAEHPFRFSHNAYRLGVHPAITEVFEWVCNNYKQSAPCPEIWVVSHEHMQDAALRTSHLTQLGGQVFGWYASRFPNKVFISDQATLTGELGKVVLVHELVHYLQEVTTKYDEIKPFLPQHIPMLELEADRLMMHFLNCHK